MKTRYLIVKLILVIVLLNQTVVAQSSVTDDLQFIEKEKTQKDVYEKETIYLNASMNKYNKGDMIKRSGLFSRLLKKEFDSCSIECKGELYQSIRNRKIGTGLIIAGTVAFYGALFSLAPLTIPIMAASLIPYGLGANKMRKGQNGLHRAIWLRNRDVLLKRSTN